MAAILAIAVALASLASHGVIRIAGIQTQPVQNMKFGANFHAPPIVATGSSLIYYGLDWEAVAKALSRPVIAVNGPMASPAELEIMRAQVPNSGLTLVGLAVSDMDEDMLSDFRADLVPAWQTWSDLKSGGADETLARRTMGQYPLHFTRWLFPTAGRSDGLLVGGKIMMHKCMNFGAGAAAEPLPTFDTSAGMPTNRISDWDAGRLLRNVAVLRKDSGGAHSFSGPKHLALERMLRRAAEQGAAVVVVLPESQHYYKNVIDADVERLFEASMADVARKVPQARWIRLDRMAGFRANENFWDLAHINAHARPKVTAALLRELESIKSAP